MARGRVRRRPGGRCSAECRPSHGLVALHIHAGCLSSSRSRRCSDPSGGRNPRRSRDTATQRRHVPLVNAGRAKCEATALDQPAGNCRRARKGGRTSRRTRSRKAWRNGLALVQEAVCVGRAADRQWYASHRQASVGEGRSRHRPEHLVPTGALWRPDMGGSLSQRQGLRGGPHSIQCQSTESATPQAGLLVDHAPHRAAGQHNVVTVLSWGSRLGRWLREHGQAGSWITIELDDRGEYWLRIQPAAPDWAPQKSR